MRQDAPKAATPGDPEAGRRNMLGLLRGLFLVLLFIFTALIIVKDSATAGGLRIVEWWPVAVGGAVLFFIGFVALDVLTPKRKLSTISAVFVGLIAGVVVTLVLGTVIDLFSETYGLTDSSFVAPFKIMLALGICYLTISTVLQTQDDFRLVIPYVEFARRIRGPRPLLLDTSALIDGRVLDVAETGVFQTSLVVPRVVIDELHQLSDSSDRMKRARGRRGLDAVSKLQRSSAVEVSVEESVPAGSTVDQQIVELARTLPASILTADTGLARVAAIRGVQVLNLNDVANALKPNLIPGEPVEVRLLRRGEQPGQAVGYLDDGTMVVADHSAERIGETVVLTVTSATQTSAGRLIFGRPPDRAEAPRERAAVNGPSAALDPGVAEEPGTDESPADEKRSDGATAPAPPSAGGPIGPGRFERPASAARNPRRG